NAALPRQERRRVGDERRLVALAALGNGGQVGAVRLNEQAVGRHLLRHVAQRLGVLVRHHAGEGDVHGTPSVPAAFTTSTKASPPSNSKSNSRGLKGTACPWGRT